MNVELLQQVKAAILEEPKRIDMYGWQSKIDGDNAPACGTVGCIAGWADILSRTKGSTDPELIRECGLTVHVSEAARVALDITHDEAKSLFHPNIGWPYGLIDEIVRTAEGTPEHAAVVAKAIDEFIADPKSFCAEAADYFYDSDEEDEDED